MASPAYDLSRPSRPETVVNAGAVLAATRPPGGTTDAQRLLLDATFEAMTGHDLTDEVLPSPTPAELAGHLERRAPAFRTRCVHMMILSALVLRPVPAGVAERVASYSQALGVRDDLLETVASFAHSDAALAAVDFERNGYTAGWSEERSAALHTSAPLAAGWDAVAEDPALAARWRDLAELPPGSLGRRVHELYRARGFAVPGTAGSAPPLLAQHDWVHVLADYGTKVDAEIEVFGFIARANDDPRGFSLLAMVISLFETGYLREGAGLFEAFPGQLSQGGMSLRLGDAMRRGALSHGLDGAPDVDLMQVDWFSLADRPLAEVRRQFGIQDKWSRAIVAGSPSPFGAGGISEAQLAAGRASAEARGERYETFGATLTG
jgi:hypothetical protein